MSTSDARRTNRRVHQPRQRANQAAEDVTATQADERLRMSDLVRLTGEPSSTIRYYLNSGLLPEPTRPKPNVAYYDPVCVDVINYIRAAQSIHRYPVSLIRANGKHIIAGGSPEEFLDLGYKTFGERVETYHRADVVDEDGLSESDLERYLDLGLLLPIDPDTLDEYDRKLIKLIHAVEEIGIPAEAFVTFANAIRDADRAKEEIVATHFPDKHNPSLAASTMELFAMLQGYLTRRYIENRD